LEGNMFHVSHTVIRRLAVLAAVLVAVAVVSPLASAKHRTALPCRVTAAQWISINDGLSVPATRCTQAASTNDCGTASLPYPGWVRVTGELGISSLIPTGSGFSAAGCSPGSSAKTTQSLNEPLRTKSRYPGWVYVDDGNGVPTLEAISSYR
jgi:hypothetical protein